MTNLRLPGQHDERLFVGRYLELDPIAMAGGFNTWLGVDWHSYAEGNPLTNSDPDGLGSEMCYRRFSPIFLMPYARHCFVRFKGNNNDTMSFNNERVGPDDGFSWLSRTCTKTSGPQDDECIKREMKKCDPKKYDFTGFNCCHCVEQAFNACGVSVPVDAWPNWPANPGPQPGEPGSCSARPSSNVCYEKK